MVARILILTILVLLVVFIALATFRGPGERG